MAFSFVDREFVPVVLGGDINSYSVARAFYEQYQVRTHVFGKYQTGPSFRSKLCAYTPNPQIDEDETFLATIRAFAGARPAKKIVVMGCGDNYVAMLARLKGELPANVIAPYVDFSLMDTFQRKEQFYRFCDKHGLARPGTFVYQKGAPTDFELDFPFPVILKPSDGIDYWAHPFETQHKVYVIESRDELVHVIGEIYASGYGDDLIIQDKIPGNDEFMRVLTTYSDRAGKVKMMCLGHVLLEEHSPHAGGNHAVIVTEPELGPLAGIKDLLEDLGYQGFANFDVKFDQRDGQFKFLDFNTRQGRSNFYVTGSGLNVAKYVVEDWVFGRELTLETPTEPHLWSVVPKSVIKKHVKDPANRSQALELWEAGRRVNPVFMRGDDGLNRTLRMLHTYLGYRRDFDVNYR
ncbi:ATP-grasp domain-containing protein [Olsenella sp. An290]|uniref:carboxylate--amine ligase n=1 Tax=Olsenella sp. An290 TaxID=1965625 RepID=UPI000B37AE13|nr:ATP-grasp domain-containing protein [Olsenella sp. An290]OUO34697.1 ATP-grasp domain-containing protein [Olsenella sp. An290]